MAPGTTIYFAQSTGGTGGGPLNTGAGTAMNQRAGSYFATAPGSCPAVIYGGTSYLINSSVTLYCYSNAGFSMACT